MKTMGFALCCVRTRGSLAEFVRNDEAPKGISLW
jgi:hypothetical protein